VLAEQHNIRFDGFLQNGFAPNAAMRFRSSLAGTGFWGVNDWGEFKIGQLAYLNNRLYVRADMYITIDPDYMRQKVSASAGSIQMRFRTST
jgi:hypothetical protein